MKGVLVAAAASLVLALLGTPWFIKWLVKRQYGQFIREDGPTAHYVKRGTPTMGGLIIIGSAVLAYALSHLVRWQAPSLSGILVLGLAVGMGFLGFLDDWSKISKERSLGLTPRGKLLFLRLRDGTGLTQGVVYRPNVGDELFERLAHLGQESSLVITGTVKANDRAPGVPNGYEIDVDGAELLQDAVGYPITPKEHGVEFLMDNRHLWLRSSRQWAVMRVRATIKRAIIDFLDNNGFLNIDTPIITPSAAEGTSTLFEVGYFGEKAYLAQTGQLYNEANIMAFGKVYCFGPTFRAEKSKTRRHLAEFWMVEPEIAFCDLDDLMALEEEFVTHVVQTTLAERGPELTLLERDVTALQNVQAPFSRISYDEAVQRIQAIREATDDPEEADKP